MTLKLKVSRGLSGFFFSITLQLFLIQFILQNVNFSLDTGMTGYDSPNKEKTERVFAQKYLELGHSEELEFQSTFYK